MQDSDRTFLPAAGHDVFLPLYDPLVKLMGGEKARRLLLEQAQLRPGHHVLDIGCGTGSLLVLIQQQYPGVHVTGIDPDPRALARAQRKADRAKFSIKLDRAFSDRVPYTDSTFDRVFSSFMFHHLEANEKTATLKEIRRVLKPGGSLHFLDFAGAPPGHKPSLIRLFHSHARLKENIEERLLSMMREAGLHDAAKIHDDTMLFFRTSYYRASAP